MQRIAQRVAEAADMMRTTAEPVPAVLVGGGSVLVPDRLDGFERVVKPDHFAVANAVGAAIAQVGGEVDRIVTLEGRSRQEVLEEAKGEEVERAVAAGADPDRTAVVAVDELPIAYLPGNSVRVGSGRWGIWAWNRAPRR